MEEIRFSTGTLAGYAVSAVLMLVLALGLLLVWRKRTHAPLRPIIVGTIVFPLFALVLKVPFAYPFLMADTELAHTISGNPWLAFLAAGILAGLLEETGRFLAYKWALKDYTTRRSAVSYGIGHGGFECLYIAFSVASILAMGILVNRGMTTELTKNLPEAQLPIAMEQLRSYAAQSFGTSLLGPVERAFALTLQIGLSVLVFAAAQEKRHFLLYPLAMLIHAWIDFSTVFTNTGMIPAAAFELLFGMQAAAVCLAAFRFIYPKLSAEGKEGAA